MFKQTIVAAILLATTVVFASENATQAEAKNVGQLTTPSFSYKQIKGFLGLGAGYTTSDSSTPADGTPTTMKILGSFYTPANTYVFDLGVGVSNQQFSKSEAFETASTATTLEAAARYQWLNKWQAGIVVNDFMNQGSNYFARQADAQFAGFQVMKEFDLNQNFLMRAGGRAMTETNPESRAVNMFLVDLQIGWGADNQAQFKSEPVVAAQEVKAQPAAPVAAQKLALSYTLNKRTAKNSKKAELATFDLAKTNIAQSDKAYLTKLAVALKNNQNLYSSIIVKGYADKSGSDEINMKLSQKRAETVSSLLQKLVGNDKQIQPVGLGSAFSKQAKLASDRKIDIEFVGVTDEAQLKKALSTIK